MKLKKGLIFALLLMVVCGSALAEGGIGTVVDGAGVLTNETMTYINERNARLNAACGAQVVLVTVETTYPYDIMQYADMLFDQLNSEAGAPERSVLILLSIFDEDYAMLTGHELEAYLSDAVLLEYANLYLEDDFAIGQYDAGGKRLFDALYEHIEAAYLGGGQEVPDFPEEYDDFYDYGWPFFGVPEETQPPIYRT